MMNRRQFLEVTALTTAFALLPEGLRAAPDTLRKKRNVLFIIVDDLRPQLRCYGDKLAVTPNIDKLAARGTLFERAYVQQAVCSPSRTSLMTGCRPDTTKIYDLQTHFRKTLPDVVTLSQHFKNAGYHAQGFSKVYHGALQDEASWSAPHWGPQGGRPYALKENLDLVESKRAEANKRGLAQAAARRFSQGPPFESADVPDNAYADGRTADEAIRVLGKVKDKPFFLAVGFIRPHLPFVAPKKYWDLYKREDIKTAPNPEAPKDFPAIAGTNWGELRGYHGMPADGPLPEETARTLIHGYYAATSYTDAQVGRLTAELERLGLLENTTIVLVGDHGWKLGEHGMWAKHANFELDTRAPMIVVDPSQKAPGKKSPALVEFVDIYPTLCELAGLPLPKHLEGTSFKPLLDDPNRPWKKAAFSQYPRQRNMGYSMRTDRYRFTLWQDPDGKVLATELYDHQHDAAENVNIAGYPDNADLVKQLTAQLRAGWRGDPLAR